jgi:hypothetical protein
MTGYRFMGQAGQLVNCAISEEKLRVVFAMFDDDARTQIAWYVFATNANAATQRACTAKYPGAAYGLWGFRESVGTFIPFNPKKYIPLNGLADPYPKGSTASLELDLNGRRLITCDITGLETKAKERVAFSFTIPKTDQNPPIPKSSRDPSKPDYKGKVYFLELATVSDKKAFDSNLIDGPQLKSSKVLIDGPVM